MNENNNFYKNMGEAAYGFFKAFLKEKKASISKFFIKNKVGFVPKGMDYSSFQKIKKKTSFKQLKFLIGNHSTLPIVLTGLWLNSLTEDEQVRLINDNKNEIYKEHREKGVNILNMGTTGFMEGFIKFLTDYNLKKNTTKEEMIDIYESVLKDWTKCTIFVQRDNLVGYIIHKCKTKMDQDIRFFYMFASYGALKIAEDVINKLHESGTLNKANYEIHMEKLTADGSRRVWIFEKQATGNV